MNGQLKEIQERLEALSGDMDAQVARLGKGEAVDLADLHKRIGDVSVDVINARPQSACFLPSLKQLVAQLDEMAVALKQAKEKAH